MISVRSFVIVHISRTVNNSRALTEKICFIYKTFYLISNAEEKENTSKIKQEQDIVSEKGCRAYLKSGHRGLEEFCFVDVFF